MTKTVLNILFLACGLAATKGAAVQAQPPILVEGLPTAVVSYADLDLSGPAGQAVLNGRVRRAAATLCVDHGSRGVREASLRQQCLDFALTQAQVEIARAIARYGNEQFAARTTITVGR